MSSRFSHHSLLFFIQLRSPLRSFMEKQIYGKAKAYDTIAADTLQSNLQNLPIVHKIQGVKMIFFVALFSRLPPSASIFCHFPWAIPKSLCLIISGCGRFFVILHLESAGACGSGRICQSNSEKKNTQSIDIKKNNDYTVQPGHPIR